MLKGEEVGCCVAGSSFWGSKSLGFFHEEEKDLSRLVPNLKNG